MAPEQLEGKPVDARADLFALGAVLYEMVTGDAPFRGRSKASLIVAILSEEPVPSKTRQPLTPPLLDHTIRRCLEKAADDRWQTAADLAAELKYITERLHTGETPDDKEKLMEPVRSRGRFVWPAALALGLIAFATWLVWRTHPSEPALAASSQRPIGAFGIRTGKRRCLRTAD